MEEILRGRKTRNRIFFNLPESLNKQIGFRVPSPMVASMACARLFPFPPLARAIDKYRVSRDK
jgi:hypothetical protein